MAAFMRSRPALCALAIGVTWSSLAYCAPWDKAGWSLTFHDEFDGSSIDATRWVKRYKWGEAVINSELQAYVDDAFEFQNGTLRIVASHKSGSYAGKTLEYRSGVISSVHEQRFGYFEMRARFPKGKGYWPAFWLLGGNGSTGVNEVDIHEFLGHDVNTVYETVHWGTDYGTGHKSSGGTFKGPDFTADFHIFSAEWDASKIVWMVDGTEVFKHTGAGVPQTKMYVIANLAVGGGWPGSPDATTVFPGYYDIDYIRAYQRDLDAGVDASADAPSDVGLDTGISSDSASDSAHEAAVDSGKDSEKDVSQDATDSGANDTGIDSQKDAARETQAPDGASQVVDSGDSGCGCTAGREVSSFRWCAALLGVLIAFRRRRSAAK